MTGGSIIFLIMFFLMGGWIGCQAYNVYYLQKFATPPDPNNPDEPRTMSDIYWFLIIYGGMGIGSNLLLTLRSLYNFSTGIWLSTQLNFKMCFRLLHTSVNRFWDKVPLGRVLNRFSRDANIVDREMPFAMNIFIAVLCVTILDFVMATVGSSQFLW